MPAIGDTGVEFEKVAREWRCKYAQGPTGPGDSTALKGAQALLDEYLPKLKALPNAEVTRIVCGGCGDFKVIVNQPAGDHGAWSEAKFAPEEEFLEKLKAIEGIARVEAQEFTMAQM